MQPSSQSIHEQSPTKAQPEPEETVQSQFCKCLIKSDKTVWHKEHQNNYDKPAGYFSHPTTMIVLISRVLLVLDPCHQ
jgi:hypothetical protein